MHNRTCRRHKLERESGSNLGKTQSKRAALSPLRYPGGKRRLVKYVEDTLRLNSLKPKLLVEPFAGGASVALHLLQQNLVDSVVLGEKDPLIAGFWQIVFSDSDWLIDQIENLSLTVESWRHFKRTSFHSARERALACIFLNRTSFSGILRSDAGPIGGYEQSSPYKIDCRFPVKTIVSRIRLAASFADRVLGVNLGDWRDTISEAQGLGYDAKEVFYYFDPPFFGKGKKLYQWFFATVEHQGLHDAIVGLQSLWLLSYDPAAPIIEMYSHNGEKPRHIEIVYSVSIRQSLVTAEELIVTNLESLPDRTRLWQSRTD